MKHSYSSHSFNAHSYNERKLKNPNPSEYKAKYYKMHDEYQLFIESDDSQAKQISEISCKPVYCVKTNKLYQ